MIAENIAFLKLGVCLILSCFLLNHKLQNRRCATSAVFGSEILKGTQLPLSSSLAFLFKTKLGVISAASSKIKKYLEPARFYVSMSEQILSEKLQ